MNNFNPIDFYRTRKPNQREWTRSATAKAPPSQSWNGQITKSDEASELQRIEAVCRYDILDTPPEAAFDRITALAARQFGTPIALITIVDRDRVWFKSRHGIAAAQMDRAPGLCVSAIRSNDPYVLNDANNDPRSFAHPLVPGIRFYAGVPLTTADGHSLGTLCVIDRTPRQIDQVELETLKDLAAMVMDLMELRLGASHANSRNALMAKETDHRLMNSLQLISGALAMQSRLPDIGGAAPQLQLASNRIMAIAQVHRHFCAEGAEAQPCVIFLRRLCEDLAGTLERSIEVSGTDGIVPSAWIRSIGLVVNELVTNAAKHGDGLICVKYQLTASSHVLAITDEGSGLPEGFDPSGVGAHLGMRLVNALVDQLGGRLKASNRPGGGSSFVVIIPSPPDTASRHALAPAS